MNRYRQPTSHLDAIKKGVSETGKRLVIILDDIDRLRLLGSLFPDASDNSSSKDIRNPLGYTNYFLNSIFEEDLVTTTTETLENEQI